MQLYSTQYQNLYRSVSGTITINNDDSMLYCDTSSGAVVINLIDIPTDRWSTQYKLYIIDNSNNAATNNITINAPTGFTINGSSSFVMSTNGESCIVKISSNTNFIAESSISGGGGGVVIAFEGTNWNFVYGNGTHTANATQLQNAYNSAKTKTPNGLPLSATNRFTIIVGAGYYEFASNFTLDTEFIDIVSLSGKTDVILNGVGTIVISTDNIKINGISVLTKSFSLTLTNASNVVCENCVGGNNSFGSGTIIISGTFINCTGGNFSFAGSGTASGTFVNCVGGNSSFGGFGGNASGTFTNCVGGQFSFGNSGTASGTFTNCVGAQYSFGTSGSTAGGTFINCIGFDDSFGGGSGGTSDGTFINCKGGENSFGGSSDGSAVSKGDYNKCIGGNNSFGGSGLADGLYKYCVGESGSFGKIASGTFTDCIGGNDCFGGGDIGGNVASGTFTNCIAGANSFGGGDNVGGLASGNFVNCKGGAGCFGGGESSGEASGNFFNCQAGAESFGNKICSGDFNNCQAGALSFGNSNLGGSVLTGKLYFCRLTSGVFQTPSGSGKITLGIDGANAIITTP